ncbi:MAG: restriction endonuclease subunit S [Thermoproteota archaeon]
MMFYKETNFKETPTGKIPKDWEVVRLGDVAKIRGSKRLNELDKVAFITMELIPSADIFAKYEIRDAKDVKSYTYCEAGDLLLPKITPCFENGKQGIVPLDVPNGFALATTEVFPIICQRIDKLFLFYILKFNKFRKILEFSMRGTTGRQRVPKDSVERLRIPLPPAKEQQQIAKILSTVDEAIQKTNEIIAKTERLKNGLMQELLTKGIGHKEFKDTEIGKIPINWEIKKVADLFSVETGTTPSTKNSEYWQEGEVNWFTPLDLSKLNGKIRIRESERKITRKALKDYNLTLIPLGSLILSTRAPVGYVAVLEEGGTFNQGCKGLIPRDKEVESLFYAYYLLHKKDVLQNLSGGSTFKELSKTMLENVKVPLPPIVEQRAIAEILSVVDQKLEFERKERERLERIKQGLMDLLLTGKVRIRVDMR